MDKEWTPRYRILTVKYCGPTGTYGSRIKIADPWHSTWRIINYSSAGGDSLKQAHDFLEKEVGIKVCGQTSTSGDLYDALLTEDFETPIKKPK